jgi:hypothetical protein
MSIVNIIELPNKISINDITKLIYKNVNGQNQELTEWQDGCEVDLKLFNITLNGFEGMIKLQHLFNSECNLNAIIETFVSNYNNKFSNSNHYKLLMSMQKIINDISEEFMYWCRKENLVTEADYISFRQYCSRTNNIKDKHICNKLVTLDKLFQQQKNIIGEYLWVECGPSTL